MGVTLLTHLLFVVAVVFGHKPKSLPKSKPSDPVMARLVEVPVKAGSKEGTEKDPSKARKGPRRRPRRQPPPREDVPREPSYTKKPPRPRPTKEPKTPEEEIKKQAMLDELAERELDSARPGALGTAEDGSDEKEARGAGGDDDEGLTDPCALTFKQDVRGYRSKIQSKVQGFKRPSFVSPDVAENLVASIRVTFDSTGKIVSVSTASSSGNPRFDAAAESYIKKLGSLGPPPRCVMFDMRTGKFVRTRSFRVRMKGK
jgi:TonB family protein